MLSKKTQYALQALSYLVEKDSDEPVLIAEIAEAKNIPLKFLETILLINYLNFAGASLHCYELLDDQLLAPLAQ